MHKEIVSESKGKTPCTQNYRVVLREIGGYHPYVTHLENLQDNGEQKEGREFYWGHYFEKYEKALVDYVDRCAKESLEPYPDNPYRKRPL